MVLVVLAIIALNMNGNSSNQTEIISIDEEDSAPVNVSQPVSSPKKEKSTEEVTISFSPVLLYLQKRDIDAAKRELRKASGAEPGSEAAQIELASMSFINFYESVIADLNRMVPPQELCKGEYSLVESNLPKKVVIRAEGKSLRFSLADPVSHGQDLFEIMYRHRKMKAGGSGNMQPDIGYAAYILFTEFADQAPAIKLLNEVQANGSPRDRETVQALKAVFKIP